MPSLMSRRDIDVRLVEASAKMVLNSGWLTSKHPAVDEQRRHARPMQKRNSLNRAPYNLKLSGLGRSSSTSAMRFAARRRSGAQLSRSGKVHGHGPHGGADAAAVRGPAIRCRRVCRRGGPRRSASAREAKTVRRSSAGSAGDAERGPRGRRDGEQLQQVEPRLAEAEHRCWEERVCLRVFCAIVQSQTGEPRRCLRTRHTRPPGELASAAEIDSNMARRRRRSVAVRECSHASPSPPHLDAFVSLPTLVSTLPFPTQDAFQAIEEAPCAIQDRDGRLSLHPKAASLREQFRESSAPASPPLAQLAAFNVPRLDEGSRFQTRCAGCGKRVGPRLVSRARGSKLASLRDIAGPSRRLRDEGPCTLHGEQLCARIARRRSHPDDEALSTTGPDSKPRTTKFRRIPSLPRPTDAQPGETEPGAAYGRNSHPHPPGPVSTSPRKPDRRVLVK
ncbi:hypothetical protein DFP72DRAFT_1106227 [Ephemerocybe angulata]|uniref:Uncharacterized protein n=1 Tax=Ephemerocybe angulata TaxID=980116 RepID=A0A8H6H856_9AGAR|nr:hypothetical protein DFP72DRAFT_1106227 [Tulosesus angulatus]